MLQLRSNSKPSPAGPITAGLLGVGSPAATPPSAEMRTPRRLPSPTASATPATQPRGQIAKFLRADPVRENCLTSPHTVAQAGVWFQQRAQQQLGSASKRFVTPSLPQHRVVTTVDLALLSTGELHHEFGLQIRGLARSETRSPPRSGSDRSRLDTLLHDFP